MFQISERSTPRYWVCQDVASAGNSGPRNLRSLLGKAVGAEIADDLPDNFEIPDHRILSLAVVHELLAPIRRVFADTLQTIREMPQIDLTVLHRGRASARTRSRK